MRGARLRWFGHVKRKSADAPMKRWEGFAMAGIRRGEGMAKNY